jgi:hypothetical protein
VHSLPQVWAFPSVQRTSYRHGPAIITFAALSDMTAGSRDQDGLLEISVKGLDHMWVTRGPWPCKPFLIHCGPTGPNIKNEFESPKEHKAGSSVWITRGNCSHGLATSTPGTHAFKITPDAIRYPAWSSVQGSLAGTIAEAWSNHSDKLPVQQSSVDVINVLDSSFERASEL